MRNPVIGPHDIQSIDHIANHFVVNVILADIRFVRSLWKITKFIIIVMNPPIHIGIHCTGCSMRTFAMIGELSKFLTRTKLLCIVRSLDVRLLQLRL